MGGLPVPQPQSIYNYGPITIGGGPSNYLITMFNRFDVANCYTICGYS